MAVDQAYQVVEVPGKGRGLVATRTLEAGELVLSEKMFLKLDSNSAKDVSVFQKLDPEIKEKLGRLSTPAEDMDFGKSDSNKYLSHSLLKKFMFNRICTVEKSDSCAVFEMISLINHSCVPNVYWFWMEDETTMEIRVLRKIGEGEEIVTTYIHLHSGVEFPLRHHRMRMLLPWKFVCRSFVSFPYISHFQTFCLRCELCALTGDDLRQNEDLRKKLMMVLKDDSTTFSQRIKRQKALKRFEEKVKLMETNWDEFCLLVNIIKIPGFCEHENQ